MSLHHKNSKPEDILDRLFVVAAIAFLLWVLWSFTGQVAQVLVGGVS